MHGRAIKRKTTELHNSRNDDIRVGEVYKDRDLTIKLRSVLKP